MLTILLLSMLTVDAGTPKGCWFKIDGKMISGKTLKCIQSYTETYLDKGERYNGSCFDDTEHMDAFIKERKLKLCNAMPST